MRSTPRLQNRPLMMYQRHGRRNIFGNHTRVLVSVVALAYVGGSRAADRRRIFLEMRSSVLFQPLLELFHHCLVT